LRDIQPHIKRDAEKKLLAVIEQVQEGTLSPADAMRDAEIINELLKTTGKKIDYTLGDFILIRENAAATYVAEDEFSQSYEFCLEEEEDED
jgi:hypothetical protein